MTRQRFLALLTGAAAFAVLGLPGPTTLTGVTGAAYAQDTEITEMRLGDPDAPVTVVEYASFTCPHCATFHGSVFKELKENYIDTGKVQFIHREVFFDRFGLWAGMVARCDGPMRYFGVVDMIYANQREWTAGGDPATIAANLRRIGLTAGMTGEQIDACMQDGEKAQSLVSWYQENAAADGIDSTPSFVIGGEKYSNMGYAEFARILDEKLTN